MRTRALICVLLLSPAAALAEGPAGLDAKTRRALIEAVCEGESKRPEYGDGIAACHRPSYAGGEEGSDDDVNLGPVRLGSFTRPGSKQALVNLDGCGTSSSNSCGTVLLERDGPGWKRVYLDKSGTFSCPQTFRVPNGRDLLICEHWTLSGYAAMWWVSFGPKAAETHDLFEPLFSNKVYDGCAPGKLMFSLEPGKPLRKDVDSDGRPDLALRVEGRRWTPARASDCPEQLSDSDARLKKHSRPEVFELEFIVGAPGLQPTPATVKALAAIEALQARNYADR
ncbi:MAG: hypothetical protein HYZ75_18280 [Elusimicrobia bacterium]|nr:hypothetical protein [Elusimicrobiota bacterium]